MTISATKTIMNDDEAEYSEDLASDSPTIKKSTISSGLEGACYDEEVASDVQVNKRVFSNNQVVEITHLIHRLSYKSRLAGRMRRCNMAGIISTEDDDFQDLPRLFSKSWSFGSQNRPRDGVMSPTDEVEVNVVASPNISIAKNKSMEFNLDMIESTHTEEVHSKVGKQDEPEDGISLEQMTDSQTDGSEEWSSEGKRTTDGVDDTEKMYLMATETDSKALHMLSDKHEHSPPQPNHQDMIDTKRKKIVLKCVTILAIMIIVVVIPPVLLGSKTDADAQTVNPFGLEEFSDEESQNAKLTLSYSPSLVPSAMPSTPFPSTSLPSLFPTTLFPTQSARPTTSYLPTTRPSINPSDAPSRLPSASPSMWPSVSPSFSPSHGPTDAPSESPSSPPTQNPSTRPTTTGSPTKIFCDIHESDGCSDYSHPNGWISHLSCTFSASFLTCSITSCYEVSPGSWQPWILFFTNALGNEFRIRPNAAQNAVMLDERDSDGSWSTMQGYSMKPSTSQTVFGVPIEDIPNVGRVHTWLVAYDDKGAEMDRIPSEGALLFTGASDVCS